MWGTFSSDKISNPANAKPKKLRVEMRGHASDGVKKKDKTKSDAVIEGSIEYSHRSAI